MLMADWQSLAHDTRRARQWNTLQMTWRQPGGCCPGQVRRARRGQRIKGARHRASGIGPKDSALVGNRFRFSLSGGVVFADVGPGFLPRAIAGARFAGQGFPGHCTRQRAWSEC